MENSCGLEYTGILDAGLYVGNTSLFQWYTEVFMEFSLEKLWFDMDRLDGKYILITGVY